VTSAWASASGAAGPRVVGTGFGYDAARRPAVAVVAALLPASVTSDGSAQPTGLCAVAAGRLDAYFEVGSILDWSRRADRERGGLRGVRPTGRPPSAP